MHTFNELAALTPERISGMTNEELLDIVCSFSAGLHGAKATPARDHRRFLGRKQLERLVDLVRLRCRPEQEHVATS